MTQAEQDLQNALISQYHLNLEFLKENDLDLYNKIETFSNMISQGQFQENFVLDFISEKGEFDILNIKENVYLYDKNAKSINANFLNNVDSSKKSTFNNLTKDIYLNRKKNIEIQDSKFDSLTSLLCNDMSEYVEILGNAYSNTKEYKKFDKFLFFGNLLGTHLKDFQVKTNFKCCFIYEENLEIFRLSLFVTDYRSLNNYAKIVFSIMDEKSIFDEKLNKFFNEMYTYSNYNIKYYKIINVDDDLIHRILDNLYLSNGSTFDYTKLLYDTFYSISKHINNYKILTTKNKTAIFSPFNNKPIIIIGAGPSLMQNIKWLKENQNKFVLVSIGAVYKKLFDNEIIPDIVTTVDPKFEILNKTHFNKNDVSLLKDTTILASINTPTKILNRFNQDKLFLFEVVDYYKNNSTAYNGMSIGEITLSLFLDMNATNIYLLGMDLSFNRKTGESHFEGYVNKRKSFDKKSSKLDEVISSGHTSIEEFIQVKGNTEDRVTTNRMFALSINQYVQIIKIFKKDFQHIYNLCEDGAFIEGAIFNKISEIAPYKDIKEKKILIDSLTNISEFGLLKKEKKELDIKISSLEEYKKILNKEFFRKPNSNNIEEFNVKFLELYTKMIKNNDKLFLRIIANYFNFVVPYIYYSFNDRNLSENNLKDKIKKIEKVFYKQVKNIIEVYESYIFQIKKRVR